MEQGEENDVVHLVLCYTEDSTGGVDLLESRKRYLDGKPKNTDILIDICIVPLGGHRGYKKKLFEYVKSDVGQQKLDAESQYKCKVKAEVWVNVDTDKMSAYGATPESVARMAAEYGFHLAVNRQNLEGEVLRMLSLSQGVLHSGQIDKINEVVQELNAAIGEFANEAMKLPKYDKNGHASDLFFERLMVLYPELIEQYIYGNITGNDAQVKTLADLLMRFDELYP